MLDGGRAHITDLGHANYHKPDVIMTQIRDMSKRLWVAPDTASRREHW